MGLARRTDFYTALCPPGGVATQTPSPWIGTSPFSVPYSTATLGKWNWGAWPSGAASQPSTAKNAPSGRSTSAADLDFGSLGRHFRLAGLGSERQIAAGDVLLDEPEELHRPTVTYERLCKLRKLCDAAKAAGKGEPEIGNMIDSCLDVGIVVLGQRLG